MVDKSFAEIHAINFVFPLARISLCEWHVGRAVHQQLLHNKYEEDGQRIMAAKLALFAVYYAKS